MIGKRVIMLKRPAVLCAAVFVVGIVTAQFPVTVAVGGAIGLFVLCSLFLRSLQRGKRRISAMDKVLFAVPLFLLFGFFLMNREKTAYEQRLRNFSACMTEGRKMLAEGVIAHIGQTATGVRLELKEAQAASYNSREMVYRPVGRLFVYTDGISAENGDLKYGQRVFVYGNGSEFEEASNPGGFDAKAYYFSLGITGAVQGKTLRIKDFSYHRLSQALFQAKNKLLERYVTYMGTDNAGVISSMLLGERSLLSDETQELYRQGGISHVLAISGLHVSLIGMALYELLRKTVLGRNGAIPVACACVLLYGTFVEAGTSTKRAVIMFFLLLLSTALGRTYDTLSAMSVSAIVILCQNPGALYTASFQLSFAAAYGASVLAVLLKENDEEKPSVVLLRKSGEEMLPVMLLRKSGEAAVPEKGERSVLADKLKNMFLFGLAIQVVTFPFTVFHFFEYATYGFLLNPLVVPLMTILLLCGFLSGVCGLLVPWLGYFFAGGAGGILWIYDGLCRFVQRLPGALLLFGRPKVGQMVLYFVALAVCLYLWKLRGRRRVILSGKFLTGLQAVLRNAKVILVVLLLLPMCLRPLPCAPFEVSFLDVGQGDGIVFRERGGAVFMIDGGSSGVQKAGQKRMIPYLKSQGIGVIDCAFVSHTDSDHISGLKEILVAMPGGAPIIKRLVLPKWYGTESEKQEEAYAELEELGKTKDGAYAELEKLAKAKKVEVYYMDAGDCMKAGRKLLISCVAPEEEVTYSDKNAASMVLKVSYGEFDLLFTGDMDRDGEKRLLEKDAINVRKDTGNTEGESDAEEDGRRDYNVEATPEIEVLKVSHHGSRTASSEEFVTALQPQIAVISCGKGNRYGHPHKETLESLSTAGCLVYRTDESGCVTIKVRKDGRYHVECWLKPDRKKEKVELVGCEAKETPTN